MINWKSPTTRAVPLRARAAVLAVVASVIQLGFSVTAKVQTEHRDLRVQPLRAVGKLPSSTKRFALIIGVDEYEDAQITKLDGASNDAKALEIKVCAMLTVG